MALPDPFPIARYRLHWRVLRPVHWPEYEGSALRGLWGHALRERACATGRDRCEGCALRERCAYPALFEPAPPAALRTYGDLTPPFVVEPGGDEQARDLAPGASYAMDLVLFGRALQQLALVFGAWQQGLAARVGPAAGALRLERIDWIAAHANALPVVQPSAHALGPVAPHAATLPLGSTADPMAPVRVHLLTPLHIKRRGVPLRSGELRAADFVWALVRRTAEVCELHLQQSTGFDFAALKADAEKLRFLAPRFEERTFRRWSNRQQRHTPLAGIVGEAVLDGPLAPFQALLHLGQWLHAGGKASFGLGQFRVQPA